MIRRPWISLPLSWIAACICASAPALGACDGREDSVRRLFEQQRWEELIQCVQASPNRSAEIDLHHGLALAQLSQWGDAREALRAGESKASHDKRFPIELAGIAFRRERWTEAKSNLRRALRLDPKDDYANEFMATVFFLEGNIEAALKYWNRIGKPRIGDLNLEPEPSLNPVLLDRAFAFSPASLLKLDELAVSKKRLDTLGVFSAYRFDLLARENGEFDARFHSMERNGWGRTGWQAAVSILRGLPYQAIHPEYFNARKSAINIRSMLRWDRNQRRFRADVSAPLGGEAGRRYSFSLDARDENWDLVHPSDAASLGSLRLRKVEGRASVEAVVNSRLSWRGGLFLSRPEYTDVEVAESPMLPGLAEGWYAGAELGLDYEILRIPEHRITVKSAASWSLGRPFGPGGKFSQLAESAVFRWLPLARGEDYEMQARFSTGQTFGPVPFDRLYSLGFDRDNTRWLRGHKAIRRGKKGAGPLAEDYLLLSWEMDKLIYQAPFLKLKVGPFVDAGRTYDRANLYGYNKWLWDAGLQCKARIFGDLSLVFTYGKDLRSGGNVFFATIERPVR